MRRHILREISSNPNAVQLSKNRLPFDKLRANGGSKRSGRTVFPNVLSEVEGSAQGERWVEAPVLSSPFVPSRASLRARGPTGPEAGRTVFPNVLSEVEGRAQHEREDLQCLYNYGPINNNENYQKIGEKSR